MTRSGEYSYSGQTINYQANIPKDGAKVTCPILLNKKLTASYIAHLDLENGKAYID